MSVLYYFNECLFLSAIIKFELAGTSLRSVGLLFSSITEEKASKIWLIPKKGVSLHFRSLM